MSDRQEDLMQIGDVATRTGLSLRTVRYYEEAGLVEPYERSAGGFRLYGTVECERLELIKQLKPMGFTIDRMKEIIPVLEQLDGTGGSSTDDYLKLAPFLESVDAHCAQLEHQLHQARRFADDLRARANLPFERHDEADES